MDASIRLNFLKGDLRIPRQEITPVEWLALINNLLQHNVLRYFGDQKPLREILHFRHPHCGEPFKTNFDTLKIEFPKGVRNGLESLGWIVSEEYVGEADKNREWISYLDGRLIVLTRDQWWLRIMLNYELTNQYNEGWQPLGIRKTSGNTRTANPKSIVVEALSEAELEREMKARPHIGSEIFFSLYEDVAAGIRNAEERLAALQDIYAFGARVSARIQ